MIFIRNNPFRLIGLTAEEGEKKLQKQLSLIRRFNEVGKSPSFPLDLPFLGPLSRTPEQMNRAAGQVEQPRERTVHALFWFINNGPEDAEALELMARGTPEKGEALWNGMLGKKITETNWSAYQNLSTLLLERKADFSRGMILKGCFLRSPYFKTMTLLVTGTSLAHKRREILRDFGEMILAQVPGAGPDLFAAFPEDSRQELRDMMLSRPLGILEALLKETEKKRLSYPYESYTYGQELHTRTRAPLEMIKTVLGEKNTQAQILEDRIALELVSCAMEFFETNQNSLVHANPGAMAREMVSKASPLANTPETRDRITRARETLEAWLKEKELRDRWTTGSGEMKGQLAALKESTPGLEEAAAFLKKYRPLLEEWKGQPGETITLYEKTSDYLVRELGDLIFNIMNREKRRLQQDDALHLKKIETCRQLTGILKGFFMEESTARQLRKNRNLLAKKYNTLKERLAPGEEPEKSAREDLDFLKEQIEDFGQVPDILKEASSLAMECLAPFKRVEKALGSGSPGYKTASDHFVFTLMQKVFRYMNREKEKRKGDRTGHLELVRECRSLIFLLSLFAMEERTREQLNRNQSLLDTQLEVLKKKLAGSSSRDPGEKDQSENKSSRNFNVFMEDMVKGIIDLFKGF